MDAKQLLERIISICNKPRRKFVINDEEGPFLEVDISEEILLAEVSGAIAYGTNHITITIFIGRPVFVVWPPKDVNFRITALRDHTFMKKGEWVQGNGAYSDAISAETNIEESQGPDRVIDFTLLSSLDALGRSGHIVVTLGVPRLKTVDPVETKKRKL